MTSRVFVVLAALHGLVAWFFLRQVGPGFPVDETWIHLVYARAFAEGQGFAYNPGQPETAVTAPIWTVLLALPAALADALSVRPDTGVRVLGGVAGFLLAAAGYRLASRAGRWPAAFAALLLTVDPLLVFDRFSGMELPLFGLLSVLLVGALLDGRETRAGILSAALVLTRPEGLLFALLAGAWLLRERRRVVRFALPAVLLVLPWVAWCQLVGGRPWPATAEAKLALAGPGAIAAALSGLFASTGWGWGLLLAAAVGAFSLEGGRRHLGLLPVLAGALLLVGVLLTRLLQVEGEPPRVPYYWARYAHVAWPLLLLPVAAGLASLVRTAYAGLLCRPAYAALLIAPLLLLFALARDVPARAADAPRRFAAEVHHIEELNVAAGLWLDDHLPPDALVAAHDAGAIRYFGRRPVLDIYGNNCSALLEVQREGGPDALRAWLSRQRPDALVVLPGIWAPRHAPELAGIYRAMPPQEALALSQHAQGADDYADLFGLTRRAATFHVDEPAAVPSPLHATMAVFVRP